MSKDLFFDQKESELLIDSLNDLPETKLFEIDFSTELNNFTDLFEEGELDIEESAKLIYKLSKQVEKAKAKIWDKVVAYYIDNFEKAELKELGIKVIQSGRYDYSHDYEYSILKEELDKRAEYLKLIAKKDTPEIDIETGEIVKPAIYNSSKQSISFSKL